MSETVMTQVRFNPGKMRRVRGTATRTQFAEMLGFTPDYVGKVERGERGLTIEALEKICEISNILPNDLFDISVQNS